MRFDGTNLYLSSYSGGSISSNTTLLTIPSVSANSAVFDYFVSDGTSKRAGSVMSAWDGSVTVYTDYSTPDIGTSTTGISFTTTTDGTNLYFNAVVTAGSWDVKFGSRLMF
jgi:hypothetical protein